MTRFWRLTALGGAFASIACGVPTDTPLGNAVRSGGVMSEVQRIGEPQIRREFRELSREAPGFTGVFFDEQGALTVAVATDSFSPHSKARALAWARRFSIGARGKRIVSIRRVPFDYTTLDASYGLVRGVMMASDSLRLSAIDETRGVIVLGLANLGVESGVRERLRAIGIPAQMVEFEHAPTGLGESTLSETVRPTLGGLRVQRPGNPGPYSCSIGFNVYKGNQQTGPEPSQGKYLLTAGHCSPQRGVLLEHAFYQDSTRPGFRIGQEVAVAPKLYGSYCQSGHSPCQDADVLVVRYDDSVSAHVGRVADVDASMNITSYFDLVNGAGMSGALTGETVTKVGFKTGKSTGKITLSCVDQLLDSIWVNCLQQANYAADAGDSGAPVFIPGSSPRMVGIHSQRTSGTWKRYFSPINQIDLALGGEYYLNPGPYSGSPPSATLLLCLDSRQQRHHFRSELPVVRVRLGRHGSIRVLLDD